MSSLLLSFGNRPDLVSGTHVASLYSQKENFLNIATSLVKTGFESSEKCFVIADEAFIEKLKEKIKDIKIDHQEKEEDATSPPEEINTSIFDSVVFRSNKADFVSGDSVKWEEFFSALRDCIQNLKPGKFRRTRLILQTDWLFEAEKSMNNIFVYQEKLISFLKENRDICIFIDCYDCSLFCGVDLLKLFSYYDGLLVEEISFSTSYFTNFKELALTDMLTGLYNERYLQERIKEEIFRAKRYRGSCSLIAIKLSNLVKDKYGEDRVNKIFVDFSDILRSNLRKVDLIAFYRKDCFGVLMPETSKKRAQMIADRIKKVFEQKLLSCELYQNADLFLKIGISNFPIDTRSAEALMALADDALNSAMKEDGHRVYSINRANDLFPPLD